MSLNRRRLLQAAAGSGLALSGNPFWRHVLADSTARNPAAKAKNCIFVFLEGGPSHIDMFDPKPGAATNGPFEAIETALDGVRFSQHLPKLAGVMNTLCLVRSLHSMEGDHERADALLHTGYAPSPRLAYPGLGSTLSRQWQGEAGDSPLFVSIGGTTGPGILGPQFGPFVVNDVNNPAPSINLPEGLKDGRIARRVAALQAFNRQFDVRNNSTLGADLAQLAKKADALRKQPVFQPYNPQDSDAELFERYGGPIEDGYFARSCILARRLVESGVRFVEIRLGGWDTHADNFNQVQSLCQRLDAGLAALVNDLDESGLLDETLVVCVGEFGRTPRINGDNGRDHHPDAFSALLAGGGVKSGSVYGRTDDEGHSVADNPVSVADFHATIYTLLGLDVAKDYFAPDGRLLRLTNSGKPVKALLG